MSGVDELPELVERYEVWLERQPLSERTRREYARQVAGYEIQREDIRRLSPLVHEHITLTGRYHIALTETIRRGEYRPLTTPDLAELASA